MSCVIGLVDNEGQIWMGSDNFATTDKGEIRPIKVQKIFRNGKYLFGYTGSVRGGQILTSKHFTPPKDIDYLTEKIMKHFQDRNFIALSSEDQSQIHMCNFLVGYKGKLYEILIDFQMSEIPEYEAIGAGASYALGSLYTTERANLSPRQRIALALRAACKFDSSCGGKLTIEKM